MIFLPSLHFLFVPHSSTSPLSPLLFDNVRAFPFFFSPFFYFAFIPLSLSPSIIRPTLPFPFVPIPLLPSPPLSTIPQSLLFLSVSPFCPLSSSLTSYILCLSLPYSSTLLPFPLCFPPILVSPLPLPILYPFLFRIFLFLFLFCPFLYFSPLRLVSLYSSSIFVSPLPLPILSSFLLINYLFLFILVSIPLLFSISSRIVPQSPFLLFLSPFFPLSYLLSPYFCSSSFPVTSINVFCISSFSPSLFSVCSLYHASSLPHPCFSLPSISPFFSSFPPFILSCFSP